MKTFTKTVQTFVSVLSLLCLTAGACRTAQAQEVTLPYDADNLPEGAQSATYMAYPSKLQSAADEIYTSRCQQGAEGLGPFSVSATTKVVFSPGNLQFNAAQGEHQCADGTKQKGTWRFAEHQWDYIGNNNSQISSSYSGWIDLFGWGTSGWSSGAKAYQPYSTSTSYSDYYPGNNSSNNLTGAYANADWGVYNQIGGDTPGTWRTLTMDEWVYLFHGRSNYANLFGLGTVNGVQGTIILPDDWVLPSGLTFNPSTGKGLLWSSTYYNNSSGNNFSHNTYTSAQWSQMEQAMKTKGPKV